MKFSSECRKKKRNDKIERKKKKSDAEYRSRQSRCSPSGDNLRQIGTANKRTSIRHFVSASGLGDDRVSSTRRTPYVRAKRITSGRPRTRKGWLTAGGTESTVHYRLYVWRQQHVVCLPSTRPVCARPYALSRVAPLVRSAHVYRRFMGPIRIQLPCGRDSPASHRETQLSPLVVPDSRHAP